MRPHLAGFGGGSRVRPARLGLVIGQLTAGGAEGQLLLLCRALDREAIEPFVYCLSDRAEPYGPKLQANGVPLRFITGGHVGRAAQLRRSLAVDRIDVVHAWLFIADAYAWLANLGSRRPLITSARNCKQQGRALGLLNRRAFAGSRAIVVNSEEVARYIVYRYGARKARIRVVYNSIDVERFHPCSRANGSIGPIVTVGRLVEQKNHALFLVAAEQLLREVPGTQFVIVGDGPLRPALEAQVRTLGIANRVTFAGERRDVEEILRTASLFWLTSRWEGLPNVVLEAMASGVPVVATDVGGVRELVRHGTDGYVLPAGDAAGFAQHTRELVIDAALRRRLGNSARARAEEFSTTRMVRTMSELYAEVLGWTH